ncbi:MAG: D-tyrosyl-tRNA(Tyr) deacylase [Candidatus Neomarinimicrobiota bacterium]|nr:MAG: D-tyrosyl-tRNA(Tyr) deacylase [Candidatus Neomarinimicrobiota bacterium]
MIAVLQRVTSASVRVGSRTVGAVSRGLVIFLGVMDTDNETDARFLVDKILPFRIFNDGQGKMNRSLLDVGGELLIISQFTLCGDWRKGRRPSFVHAAPPDRGRELYLRFIALCRERGVTVAEGEFGAMMEVELINDGPVTFVLDSARK